MGQSFPKKDLFTLYKENSFQEIQNIISKGVDVNSKNENEETILHLICKNENQFQNQFQMIEFLISKGADVNAKTNYSKETPLQYACQSQSQNSIDVIKFLISKGADVNAKNDVDETPLHYVCKTNSIESVKFLVSKGADVNAKTKYNETALHYSCRFQNENTFEFVKFFISKGLDINDTNYQQETSLHLICKNGNENTNLFEMIKFLFEKGADINAKTKYNETALQFVCQSQNPSQFEIVKFLISKGADFNLKTNSEETYLHLVCKQPNSLEIVEFLVSKGLDVNARTFRNETPLILACQQNLIEIAKYLISKGANVNVKLTSQQTPLLIASEKKSFEMVKVLIENGADVNLPNFYQETALLILCKLQIQTENSLKIVKFLVQNGANINAKTTYDETPFFLAIHNQNNKLYSILIANDFNAFDIKQYRLISQENLDLWIQIYSINQDLNNFFKLNQNENFSDFQIESNDGFKFNVHKLILSSRLDYNQSILEKFIVNCQKNPKQNVQIALNFLYTGFPDFDQFYDQIDTLKNSPDSFYSEKKELKSKWNQKKKIMQEFFKQIGFDLKWIESKKGIKGILKDLKKLYQQNDSKDFKIIIEENGKEKEIKVHKLVLIIRSELFKGMFQLNIEDKSNQVHDYSKKSFQTLNQIIYFLYHDKFDKEIKINREMKEELRDVKDYYQLNENSIIDLFLKKI
ncbi:ankyrin repeat-containing protein [Anaeramoeba ignava]|uniref:Ankyrin repeat-containing protein n=1 Tax=Anaeramoeba ignava TaxID=1746090 RepID=A0A9Q0LST7_ANAIG|nr:ankyrin repeat-containing protein [Anaeramoeba ignava]